MVEGGISEGKITHALKSFFQAHKSGNILFITALIVNIFAALFYRPSFLLNPPLNTFVMFLLFAILGLTFIFSLDSNWKIKTIGFFVFPFLYVGFLFLATFLLNSLEPYLSYFTPFIWVLIYTFPLLFIMESYDTSKFLKIFFGIWFVSLLVLGLITVQANTIKFLDKADATVPKESQKRLDIFVTGIKEKIFKIKKEINQSINKQIALATGDYYTGQVDQNAKVKLGVYLEEIKLTEADFYTDQSVSIFARLKAQTLDQIINVSLSCKGENADKKIKVKENGIIYPQSKLSVATYESQDVDCEFPKNSFSEGTATISLGAEFDFKTISYIKTYFMDKDRLREMRKAGLDPLTAYNILDKKPNAVYTNGPVKIGMNIGEPPIGINQNQEETIFTVGVTVENAWPGKIKNISKIILQVPKGFEIDSSGISGDVQTDGLAKTCEDIKDSSTSCSTELYNIYILSPRTRNEIDKFINFRVRVRANRADYNLLLGNSPLATRFFKTTVEYTYTFENKISVNIKKVKDEISGSETQDPPALLTTITHTKDKNGLNLTYTTNKKTTDTIKLFKSPNTLISQTLIDDVPQRQHKTRLSGLIDGTSYNYEIWSVDTIGTVVKIADKTFIAGTTANSDVPVENVNTEINQFQTNNPLLSGELIKKSGPQEFILEYNTDRPTIDLIIITQSWDGKEVYRGAVNTNPSEFHQYLSPKLLGEAQYNFKISSTDTYGHSAIEIISDSVSTLKLGATA